MYPVTQQFKDEMVRQGRRVYGRVEIDYTDPFLDQSIQVTYNENASVSYPEQVKDNIQQTYGKIASLDGSWILDGSWVSAPTTPLEGQMGWWGSQLSGSGGNFTIPYPTLTVTFLERPIRQLKVFGDINRGEYPVDFTVNMYNANEDLLHTETVTGNTEINYLEEFLPVITSVAKMELIITKWSHVGRQAKIIEFITSIQEVYEGEELISLKLVEDKETSGGTTLPVGNISSNEISVQIANEDRRFDVSNTNSPLYQLLKQNRRIRAWIGTETELVPLGQFWSGEWDIPEQSRVITVRGNDRLNLLTQTMYATSVVKENVTLYELAEDVLGDAGLSIEEYQLSNDLENYIVPYGYFNLMSHRDALRLIAGACLGQVYCDREGIIRVDTLSDATSPTYPELWVDDDLYLWQENDSYEQQFEYIDGNLYLTPDQTITRDEYFRKNAPVKWSQIANIIELDIKQRGEGSSQQIFSVDGFDTIPANTTQTIRISYDKYPVKGVTMVNFVSPANAVQVLDSKFYSWGADITLENTSGSEGTFSFQLTGIPLEVIQTRRFVKEDSDSIIDNGRITYTVPNNDFIQTPVVATKICDDLLSYYSDPRKDVEIEWRGNPAWELGDMVTVVDEYGLNSYVIVGQEIDFKGSLRARMRGRAL